MRLDGHSDCDLHSEINPETFSDNKTKLGDIVKADNPGE